MGQAITRELYEKARAHKDERARLGKFRCGYERTRIVFEGDINEAGRELGDGFWVCSECGEVIEERRV